jgi:hypothetical protein
MRSGIQALDLARARSCAKRQWPMLALTAWAVFWFAVLAPGGGIAWHFFVTGSRLLFGGSYGSHDPAAGGLHLYANYPSLQIGPLSFTVAELLRVGSPGQGLVAAQLVISGMGLCTLAAIRQIVGITSPELAHQRRTQWTFLAGGAAFMIAWEELAVYYGHLDDGLALLAAVLALRAAVTGRPALAGLAIGLAADAKPWALGLLPILLVCGSMRGWLTAGTAAMVTFAAAWLPFLLADPGTLAAFHYKIANLPDSGLRVVGVTSAGTPPWARPAQVLVGCALGTLAIWRGRWPAVFLVGVGARIALDPAVHGYYTAGVLAGALIWDMTGSRRPVPLWTMASYGALDLVPLLTRSDQIRGDARFYLVAAFTAAVLLGPAARRWPPSLPQHWRSSDREPRIPLAEAPGRCLFRARQPSVTVGGLSESRVTNWRIRWRMATLRSMTVTLRSRQARARNRPSSGPQWPAWPVSSAARTTPPGPRPASRATSCGRRSRRPASSA